MASTHKIVVTERDGTEKRFACGSREVCDEQARIENACARMADSGRVYRVEPCAACAASR